MHTPRVEIIVVSQPAELIPGAFMHDEAFEATLASLRDWLLTDARLKADIRCAIAGFAHRLNAVGVPVDRLTFAAEALHAEHVAFTSTWLKDQPGLQNLQAHGWEAIEGYPTSPLYAVHQSRQMLALRLRDTSDDLFPIVAELKQAGYLHYLCFPVFFANGHNNAITLATRSEQGFSERDIALLACLMPTLVAVLEIQSGYKSLDEVLRIYVGDEPHRAILAGRIGRGQVSRIRSAILFADMRSYTRITSAIEPEQAVELLNRYFDCLVPPIEAEGGEVLKYMGDGLLAIFRDRGDDLGAAAQSALSAATVGLACIEQIDPNDFGEKIQAGIALHHGDAAYGNVGSGARLDFTVVGRDVNLTSRLAQLNKVLGEPLLMSRAFCDHLWSNPHHLGAFRLDGFEDAIDVFRP
ncbi:adenylate/guanylate cyclase domain-containing protein [Pseudochelatococcus sp. G4_1912]|uniref:adenylate/guanylate cyclase domain-containing protein n=1 Tax=Pseudochelatococcus sp. G4_1912 TaxID=3114288 RepID=UPI0039C5D079